MNKFEEGLVIGMLLNQTDNNADKFKQMAQEDLNKIAIALTTIGVNTPIGMSAEGIIEQIKTIIQIGLGNKIIEKFKEINLNIEYNNIFSCGNCKDTFNLLLDEPTSNVLKETYKPISLDINTDKITFNMGNVSDSINVK